MEISSKLYLPSFLLPQSIVSTPTVLMPPVVCTLPRDPAECSRQRKERMSSFAHGLGQLSHTSTQLQHVHSTSRFSLNDLSTELLALIFEQLRDIDPQYIATARLLCRRFNQIAIPVAYKVLALNDRILHPNSEHYFPHCLQYIYMYTNHVIARSDLDPNGIRRILERLRKFSSLRWRYTDRSIKSGGFWTPSDVLNAAQCRRHNTKLFVEDLPLRDFEGEMRNTYLRAIPVELLTSLKMAHPAPPLVTRLNSFKNLLLSAPRLETLHFEDRGQGTQFNFQPNERLPPFRELSIRSYDWRHTPEDVVRHWDFSRITSLELISVPLFNFLSSVNFNDFANLHTLHCEDFSAHLTDLRQEATSALVVLIKSYVRSLSTLSITVHTAQFPIDALLPHAHSLTTLRLRDHTGFGEDDRRCPTLYHDDVALMARYMRHLEVLELDMDIVFTDPPAFLRAICAFPALHTLTLHVQTLIHPYETIYPGQDRDYEAAIRTMQFLMINKMSGSWRSITINVGGWKKVMVRRLSEAWRRQNEMGVFAERCFVAERNGVSGQLNVREEYPVEASRDRTPEEEQRDVEEIEDDEEEQDDSDDYDDDDDDSD